MAAKKLPPKEAGPGKRAQGPMKDGPNPGKAPHFGMKNGGGIRPQRG